MLIKYIAFIFTLLWSYSFIKSQSFFKKGTGFLITIFISNISWLTFIAACYYGLKNFSFYYVLCGIFLSIILVHLALSRLSLYINSKFSDKNKLIKIKVVAEYIILALFVYYIFFN
jgi:hypothetical protein|tara:strand:+ start:391 stop:738 length:348 start_codon:yes stop_codon:yes gene_type:complete